jgi:hypothetical protein
MQDYLNYGLRPKVLDDSFIQDYNSLYALMPVGPFNDRVFISGNTVDDSLVSNPDWQFSSRERGSLAFEVAKAKNGLVVVLSPYTLNGSYCLVFNNDRGYSFISKYPYVDQPIDALRVRRDIVLGDGAVSAPIEVGYDHGEIKSFGARNVPLLFTKQIDYTRGIQNFAFAKQSHSPEIIELKAIKSDRI